MSPSCDQKLVLIMWFSADPSPPQTKKKAWSGHPYSHMSVRVKSPTVSPRRHFQPHSTLWWSDRVRRCTDRGFPSWMKDPANKHVHSSALLHVLRWKLVARTDQQHGRNKINLRCYLKKKGKKITTLKIHSKLINGLPTVTTYRHGAFVSCEFVEMLAGFSFPNHDQLVHVSGGLKKCLLLLLKLFVTLYCKCVGPHQIFSVGWYGHAQYLSRVSNMAILRTLPSTRYDSQLFPALDMPWKNTNADIYNIFFTFTMLNIHWGYLTFNYGAVFCRWENALIVRADDQASDWELVSS